MANKEEIAYNIRSLLSAWLDKNGDIGDVFIELSGDGVLDTVECTIETFPEVAAGLLCENNGKYKELALCKKVGEGRGVVGVIGIQ
jgi:hypothetical protein